MLLRAEFSLLISSETRISPARADHVSPWHSPRRQIPYEDEIAGFMVSHLRTAGNTAGKTALSVAET